MRFFIRASELLGFSSRLIFITLPILSSRVVGLGRLHPTSSRLNTDNKDGRNLRNVFSYFFPFISFNSSISFNSKKTKSEYKKNLHGIATQQTNKHTNYSTTSSVESFVGFLFHISLPFRSYSSYCVTEKIHLLLCFFHTFFYIRPHKLKADE